MCVCYVCISIISTFNPFYPFNKLLMNDLHGSLHLQQALLFIFMQIQTYKLAFLLFLYMVDIIILIFFT